MRVDAVIHYDTTNLFAFYSVRDLTKSSLTALFSAGSPRKYFGYECGWWRRRSDLRRHNRASSSRFRGARCQGARDRGIRRPPGNDRWVGGAQMLSHFHVFLFFRILYTTFCSAFVVSGANVGGSCGFTMSTKRDSCVDSQSSEGFRIGFLSDVEGHWDYFL
jgi:hypothetical protein